MTKYIGDDCKVVHLYPSRTQKLSTLTPTIVKAKIGSCQYFFMSKTFKHKELGFFVVLETKKKH